MATIIICPNCGNQLKENEKECRYCGTPNPAYNPVLAKKEKEEAEENKIPKQTLDTIDSANSKAIASMVIGILGFVTGLAAFLPFPIIGMILGIVAKNHLKPCKNINQKAKSANTYATVGFILNLAMLIIVGGTVLIYVFFYLIIIISTAAGAASSYVALPMLFGL